MIDYFYILGSIASIVGLAMLLFRWLSSEKIQLFLCNNQKLPRCDVSVEGEFRKRIPNKKGRVFVDSRYIGTVIRVYDRFNGRFLISQKLIKTGKDSTITVIIPDKV